jgi:DNA polymerase-3 subunit epsilon
VEATVKLFQLLQQKDDQFIINSFLNPRSKQATLPPLLKKEVVDKLPETFGVYYFRNEKKQIIYVGKANNIKQRVISHFYDKKRKEVAMCLEIAHIDFTETGSELLALLLESAEIKKIFPKYNAAQKRRGNAFGIFSYLDQKGIRHIAYNSTKAMLNPLVTFDNITACRVFIEKLCSAYELCPKYCHLQENVKQCFHHQIQECRGICCGKEAIESYNERVELALKEIQLQNSDVVIKESGRTQDEIGFVLILNGTYQGFGYLPSDIAANFSSPEDYQFYLQPQQDNSDVQRILRSYLRKKEAPSEASPH